MSSLGIFQEMYKSFNQPKAIFSNSALTFEDLSIDVNLSEIDRLVKYVKSTIGLQRLVHVKLLSSISISVGFRETLVKILPLLDPLSRDCEPAVRQHLVEQFSPLSIFFSKNGEDGYQSILHQLLPLTARLLEDEKPEVRAAASSALSAVSSCINQNEMGQFVLTIILRLAHEDEKEEMRMLALELLNSLAENFGSDLCRQFIIPEVVSLCEDPVFRVRKAAALNFSNICKVGGEHELFERLMPAFVRLSKDEMYRVRRACADSLSEISKFVGEDIRIGVLTEIFLRLTQDSSRVVKQSALQQTGMFISTLSPKSVTDALLSHFLSMVSDPTGDPVVDAELKHCCAFCFPAVLQTIGPARWFDLRQTFRTLVHSKNVNVKQTLASSLHEIARIFGDETQSEEELVPIFEELIQETEAIQAGLIKHLAEFLSMLPTPCRISYLPLLHDILHSTNPFNWRIRQSLAHQLPDLVVLSPVEKLHDCLFPLVMTLLQDPVSCVRRSSYHGVSKLISTLESNINSSNTIVQFHLQSIITSINSLIFGETYQMRQLWVELCQIFLSKVSKQFFLSYLIRGIETLVKDSVCNVRISLARLLSDFEDQPFDYDESKSSLNWLLSQSSIQNCVEILSIDHKDVFDYIVRLKTIFPTINFRIQSKSPNPSLHDKSTCVAEPPVILNINDINDSNRDFKPVVGLNGSRDIDMIESSSTKS